MTPDGRATLLLAERAQLTRRAADSTTRSTGLHRAPIGARSRGRVRHARGSGTGADHGAAGRLAVLLGMLLLAPLGSAWAGGLPRLVRPAISGMPEVVVVPGPLVLAPLPEWLAAARADPPPLRAAGGLGVEVRAILIERRFQEAETRPPIGYGPTSRRSGSRGVLVGQRTSWRDPILRRRNARRVARPMLAAPDGR